MARVRRKKRVCRGPNRAKIRLSCGQRAKPVVHAHLEYAYLCCGIFGNFEDSAYGDCSNTPIMIEERIAAFRADLRQKQVHELVQRHITSGECFTMVAEAYFDLRNRIANQFQIHFSGVVVVGSAKLGFSIAPDKRYRAFGETSDIGLSRQNRDQDGGKRSARQEFLYDAGTTKPSSD
jgi:hypothetical protein